MKSEWRNWLGQSMADKLVTGAIALVSAATISISQAVGSRLLQEMLLYTGIAGLLVLVLMLYLNQRLAKVEARLQESENLHVVSGFIVQHRIQESPRTPLDRKIRFHDPTEQQRAVNATVHDHRKEILELVRDANPEMSSQTINALLDVFYGLEQPVYANDNVK